jgi:hypothetical protein
MTREITDSMRPVRLFPKSGNQDSTPNEIEGPVDPSDEEPTKDALFLVS